MKNLQSLSFVMTVLVCLGSWRLPAADGRGIAIIPIPRFTSSSISFSQRNEIGHRGRDG